MGAGAIATSLWVVACATGPGSDAEPQQAGRVAEAKPQPAPAPSLAAPASAPQAPPAASAEPSTPPTSAVDVQPAVDVAAVPEPTLGFDGVRHVAATKFGAMPLDLRSVYWAESSGGRLVIDTIHGTEGEFESLLPAQGEATGGAAPPEGPVALEQFRAGEALTLVHDKGPPRTGTLASFAAEYGASDGHLTATFDAMKNTPAQALVVRTAAGTAARLRPVAIGRRHGPTTRAVMDAVKAELDAAPASKTLRAKHVTAAPLGHVRPGATLVVVAIPRFDPDEDSERWWSAAFALEADGTRHVLVEAEERPHRVLPLWLVDLHGDGVDEVVFATDYQESSGYVYLAGWTGSQYANLRLSGDGG